MVNSPETASANILTAEHISGKYSEWTQKVIDFELKHDLLLVEGAEVLLESWKRLGAEVSPSGHLTLRRNISPDLQPPHKVFYSIDSLPYEVGNLLLRGSSDKDFKLWAEMDRLALNGDKLRLKEKFAEESFDLGMELGVFRYGELRRPDDLSLEFRGFCTRAYWPLAERFNEYNQKSKVEQLQLALGLVTFIAINRSQT